MKKSQIILKFLFSKKVNNNNINLSGLCEQILNKLSRSHHHTFPGWMTDSSCKPKQTSFLHRLVRYSVKKNVANTIENKIESITITEIPLISTRLKCTNIAHQQTKQP